MRKAPCGVAPVDQVSRPLSAESCRFRREILRTANTHRSNAKSVEFAINRSLRPLRLYGDMSFLLEPHYESSGYRATTVSLYGWVIDSASRIKTQSGPAMGEVKVAMFRSYPPIG